MADKFSDEALAKFLEEPTSPTKDTKIKDDEKPVITKYKKPDWADKKDDDYNSYEYSDNEDLSDSDW